MDYRQHLLDYFSDGEPHSPSELDREVLGIYRQTLSELFALDLQWNKSPYCAELGKLVDDGTILAYQLPDGRWQYQLANSR